eukprot:CAMPEP_0182898364 /NCGR_PEP_ID=MMETSP0034_2-20130328/27440_1 /TAXON_ID=156128 /ORGANISM="Nephroselmis pyriformis, Strain CCMP717" /LENGTH=47 /DNA_ID= /DNA_START= /DNA_END= /DNA_ORIENTATION=
MRRHLQGPRCQVRAPALGVGCDNALPIPNHAHEVVQLGGVQLRAEAI